MAYNIAETCLKETLCDCTAYGHGVSLAEGTRGVLDSAFNVELGVTGADASPLAQLLQLVGGVFACEGEHRIKHRRHVARIEEEAVAGNPCGIIGVGYKKLRIKHVYKVCTAHGATGVAGFGFFNHRSGKHADGVGCTVYGFSVHRYNN